jgi:hypothetical protein
MKQFIYRLTPGSISGGPEFQKVDRYDGYHCLDYIRDNYLYDSSPGERYFVIDSLDGMVIAEYVVEQGPKVLVDAS